MTDLLIPLLSHEHRREPPRLLPPDGFTHSQAQALAVQDDCPPALLDALARIARRVASDQCGTLSSDQPGLYF